MDHKILNKQFGKYRKHHHIDWFKSYLNSRKQYVRYSEGATPSEETKCGVPQGVNPGSINKVVRPNNTHR